MAKRTRPIQLSIYFTSEEWDIVQSKMAQAGVTNFSLFAREMLLTGEVKCYDFSVLKEISRELARLAGSINQIAKRCNETRSLYWDDVEQLKQEYMEVKALAQERLCKLLRKI
ncbi:MAG: plasmid mobilization protein [Blautia massiliensis (ex Durand et al. 2017)]|nr:MAG: plasmid mobilization relaxosome protein MobC [Subdoligranulum variabile]